MLVSPLPPSVQRTQNISVARGRLGKFIERKAQEITRVHGVHFEETATGAPSTYLEIVDMYLKCLTHGVPFLVDSNNSEDTIYPYPSMNWSFRFWHDWLHASHRLTLSFMDEIKVGLIQLQAVREEFGVHSLEAKLMASETIGQAVHHEMHGEFVEQQRAFATEQVLAIY